MFYFKVYLLLFFFLLGGGCGGGVHLFIGTCRSKIKLHVQDSLILNYIISRRPLTGMLSFVTRMVRGSRLLEDIFGKEDIVGQTVRNDF